jgi:hypothetical protein
MTDAFERAVARDRASHRRRRRAGARACWRAHLAIYASVNAALLLLWALELATGAATGPWFLYVAIGWGGGLLGHYLAVRPALRRPVEAAGPGVT